MTMQNCTSAGECDVLQPGRVEHITPALTQLHWLHVRYQVTFKLVMLAFKIKPSGQCFYTSELINDYVPGRCLCSSTLDSVRGLDNTITVLALCACKHQASAIWNNLDPEIRSCNTLNTFKQKRKAHCFNVNFTITNFVFLLLYIFCLCRQ
jgi:hypothetical protein